MLMICVLLSNHPCIGFLPPNTRGGIQKASSILSKVTLWQERNAKQGGSVRFSGSDATITNPVDSFLSFISSDIVSIVLGILGLLAVVIHRWALLDESADALTLQTRTDLLATFACGSVLLNGVTKLDVTTALAESVVLEGIQLTTPEFLDEDVKDKKIIKWGLESLLAATPAKSAVLLRRSNAGTWAVSARAGKVPSNTTVPQTTPILTRVATPGNTKETYLPTLQALPGKTEFPYLPLNSQLAVLIPVDKSRVLVLGGNTSKSFTPRDVAWSRIVADQMSRSQ
eukprot:scaffold7987_cov200-Cylindrotheca_fusiformis.AAC.2